MSTSPTTPQPPHWLSLERVRLYSLPLLAAAICLLLLSLPTGPQGQRIAWLPIGDFIAYWSAGELSLQGQAVAAYQLPLLVAREQAALPGFVQAVSWHYPPSFLLLVTPLALLPLSLAWLVFMLGSLLLYTQVLRRSLGHGARLGTVLLLLLAFAGSTSNLLFGQNAFLTAALMGGGLYCLRCERPLLAGLCFGLLSIKPQLGLLLPLALACGGHWRAFMAAALSTLGLLLLSLVCFGIETLPAFWSGLQHARDWLESAGGTASMASNAAAVVPMQIDPAWLQRGALDRSQIPSLFAFARELGAPLGLAYGLHISQALLVAGVVALGWYRRLSWTRRAALLSLGSLLVTPYLFDYEMAWLLLPIAYGVAQGLEEGWGGGRHAWLLLAYLLPLPLLILAKLSSLPWLQFQLLAWFIGLCWSERYGLFPRKI